MTPRRVGILLVWVVIVLAIIVVALRAMDDDEDKSAGGKLVARDAWVRVVPAGAEMPAAGDATPAATPPAGAGEGAAPGGMNAGAFMTLRNETGADARLVSVSVPASVARAAELHETTVDASQVMRMRPVEGIDIPRGGEVQLAPGGLHIMLLDVQPSVVVGDKVELTLTFADGATLVVPADVREAG